MSAVLMILVSVFTSPYFGHAKFIYNKDKMILSSTSKNYDQADFEPASVNDSRYSIYKNIGTLIAYPGQTDQILCTASLIDTSEFIHNNKDAPAYAITAGHCYHRKSPDSIFIDEPNLYETALHFGVFHDSENDFLVPVERIEYSTMNGTDVSLVRLSQTHQEMVKRGYKGIKLAHSLPQNEGDALETLGIPLYALSKDDRVPSDKYYLHKEACEFQGINAELVAHSHIDKIFRYRDSIKSNCSFFVGFSGGPMLSLKNDTIIGVNARGGGILDSSYTEMPKELIPYFKLRFNDSSNTTVFARCFDEKGVFDLKQKGCNLERPCSGQECKKKECEKGDARKCFIAEEYEKGCELGEPLSCMKASFDKIANQEEFEKSTEEVQQSLVDYAQKGCDGGEGNTCAALGSLALRTPKLAKKLGINTNSLSVLKQLDKACVRGSDWACYVVGYYLSESQMSEISKKKSISYLFNACFLGGLKESCDRLELVMNTFDELKPGLAQLHAFVDKYIKKVSEPEDKNSTHTLVGENYLRIPLKSSVYTSTW